MKKRYLALGAVMVLLGICTVLVGYLLAQGYLWFSSRGRSTESPQSHPRQLEIQIFEGGYGKAFWRKTIAEFQKEYPDIQLTVNIGYDVNEEMKIRWIAGNGPDIVFTDGPTFPKMAFQQEGKFLDVSSWLDEVETDPGVMLGDVILPQTVRYFSDGKLYILPYMLSSWELWYDAASLQPPANSSEAQQLMDTLTQAGVPLLAYPGQYPLYLSRGILYPALVQQGGEPIAQRLLQADASITDDPAFRQVLRQLKELADNDLLARYEEEYDHIGVQKEWAAHKIAFVPGGLWLPNEMKNYLPAEFSPACVNGLIGEDAQEEVQAISTIGWAVSATTRNEDEAKAFIGFLYRGQVLRELMESLHNPVACRVDMQGLQVQPAVEQQQQRVQSGQTEVVMLDFIDPRFESTLTEQLERFLFAEGTLEEIHRELLQTVQSTP